MSTSQSPAVRVRGLRKSYGSTTVLDDVDLDVARGSVVALLGPNGAGKTTTINVLSTLTRPDGGTAQVCGHDVASDPSGVRRAISLTGQSAAVDDLLTGRENLTMMARLQRVPRREVGPLVSRTLRRFDLEDAADRRVGTYSGGMRRRVDIALGVLARPEVLFLDEPTTGLDPRSRQEVWSVVRDLVDAGVTVLLTTQYLEEADQLADRVVVLDHGRIIAQGTPSELKARAGRDVIELHLQDGTVRREPTDGTLSDVRRIIGRLDEVGDTDGSAVHRVGMRSPSLDDVFLALTGQPPAAGTASTDHTEQEQPA